MSTSPSEINSGESINDYKKGLISFFIPSLRSGGAEKVWISVAKLFAENGFDVDLIVAQSEGPYLQQISPLVNLVDFKKSHIFLTLIPLVVYLVKNKPIAIFSALNHTNIVSIFAKYLSFQKVLVIISIHNDIVATTLKSNVSKNRLLYFLLKSTYRFADKIIAVSSSIANEITAIARVPQDLVSVIHNPVVSSNLFILSNQKPQFNYINSLDVPLIISAGRFVPQKDFITLIKSFSIVRKEIPSKLILLGEGPQLSKLKEFTHSLNLQDDVYFPGFVDNPYSFFSHSSVFVLSSIWEGFGNVLVEALACGIPVVSTNCGGPNEILENGKYGSLCPIGDFNCLAASIVNTLDNPPQKSLLKQRAEDFSETHIFEKYLNLLESLL
jgi:glycosyltransferase involved in cell wall biosynthesis